MMYHYKCPSCNHILIDPTLFEAPVPCPMCGNATVVESDKTKPINMTLIVFVMLTGGLLIGITAFFLARSFGV